MSRSADSCQLKASDDKVTPSQDDDRKTNKSKGQYGDSGFARMTSKGNGKGEGKGNDNGNGKGKGNGNGNDRSRFPSGMTKKLQALRTTGEKQAKTKAKA